MCKYDQMHIFALKIGSKWLLKLRLEEQKCGIFEGPLPSDTLYFLCCLADEKLLVSSYQFIYSLTCAYQLWTLDLVIRRKLSTRHSLYSLI